MNQIQTGKRLHHEMVENVANSGPDSIVLLSRPGALFSKRKMARHSSKSQLNTLKDMSFENIKPRVSAHFVHLLYNKCC